LAVEVFEETTPTVIPGMKAPGVEFPKRAESTEALDPLDVFPKWALAESTLATPPLTAV
jgi:hypothetical protein